MRVEDIQSIRIKLASPEDILNWSNGEVIKPETINYRTQRSEKDGLFCEKIFGPEKDYQCYCGKYRGIKYKGIICDRCGVELMKSQVRRERMGHIKLAAPVSHIWFLRGLPSRMGIVLNTPIQQMEKVIYFAAYIITKVNEEEKKKTLEQVEKEYKTKSKKDKSKELKALRDKVREEILNIKPMRVLFEKEYSDFSLKYGEIFEAGTGAETLRKIFAEIDTKKEIAILKKKLDNNSSDTLQPMEKRKTLNRLKIFQSFQKSGVRPEWMFLTVLPVLPPDLRPMVQLDGGRYASSDLNDLYRRVINRNNRLKYLLEIEAPEVIVRNEKRMLQEAVDALIDNGMRKGTTTLATTGGKRLLKSLSDILKGKQGRFRQNLLGKRVDYSGRSVIVVGPGLKLNQCGLPKKMALELFKPFVIKRILDKELAYNVRGAGRIIEEEGPEVWEILEEIVKDKMVLLNRAPTLHRLGIQAFQPILIEGEVIQLHPLCCSAFNADFDGDQMAVHLPLSDEAQREAREIMSSNLNLLKPATGTPVVSLSQDIILGCYCLTEITPGAKGEGKVFSGTEEAILAFEAGNIDIHAKIKIRAPLKSASNQRMNQRQISGFLETSLGRILFNETLPKDFPFQNKLIRSKEIKKIASLIISKYKSEEAQKALDKIKDLGFEYSSQSGISWGIDDLIIPPQKPKIIEQAEKEVNQTDKYFQKGLLSQEEKTAKIIEIWTRAKSEIEELVPKTLPKNGSVFQIVNAGARGSWSQPVQMSGIKGLVINPLGQIIEFPVKHCYKEGFDVLEYFISTHGARKGTVDTALRTSAAGYLTRRLVDVAHGVIINKEDCGDKKGIDVFQEDADEIGQNFLFKIVGRTSCEDVKNIVKTGEIIDWEKGEKIMAAGIKKVRIRSPLSCKLLRGICQKCYGWDSGLNQPIKLGGAVGIIAAQAIGEPGTQLTLKTFHTGGVASGGDITSGLPRVQEVLEVRIPGGKAEMVLEDGKVLKITSDNIIKIKSKIAKKDEVVEYKIPLNAAILVKPGQVLKKGDQLCEGNLDLKEVFKAGGQELVQRYIIKEIQRIYVSQGVQIHDKHIEVICGQMFSRMKIKEPGDSLFSSGEIVERAKLFEENALLKKEKKRLAVAVPILLGISKIALTTDSFLSAASFQETSRVLIKAAIIGKEDKLRGLKENVIIGKLIPAGTGFKK
ncbi:DNA-directed RNA polymerase subunit beta' [Candidatus Parcubacteria bacterium]|nr:DNA-directed RNA polymerase subunit beta' [Candidatus Parcubacteria bacterium]